MTEYIIIGILSVLLVAVFCWRRHSNEELKKELHNLTTLKSTYAADIETAKNDLFELNSQLEMRQNQVAREFQNYREAKQTAYKAECELIDSTLKLRREQAEHTIETLEQQLTDEETRINEQIVSCRQNYESLIEPLRRLEQEKQDKSFYCIQLSEDDKSDIAFLTKEVAPRLKHEDILSKLIWSEYFQKPFVELMKRIGMDDTAGIYRITNINNGMTYIGQATKLKSRCQNHVKGALGIRSVTDQKIHQAMLQEGPWNFMFEKLCDCTVAQLDEKEKFFIDFFQGNEYGYNLTKGNTSKKTNF